MLMLLLSGCATAPSKSGKAERVDRIIVPAVKAYTPKTQKKAAAEMKNNCVKRTPTLCDFIVDYGKMRDQARVATGQKVDVKR